MMRKPVEKRGDDGTPARVEKRSRTRRLFRFRSIRTRIIVIFILFFFTCFAFMVAVNTISINSFSNRSIQSEIRNIAVTITPVTEKYLLHGDGIEGLTRDFPNLFLNGEYELEILPGTGNGSTFLNPAAFAALIALPEGGIVHSGWKRYFVIVRRLSADQVSASGTDIPGGSDLLYLVIGKRLPVFSEIAARIFQQSALGFLIIAVPAMILLFVILRKFTGPIDRMNDFAHRIAESDFRVTLETFPDDEIGRLSESLNRMAVRLAENEKEREVFLAGVSHELRTPLTTIKVITKGIMDGIISPGETTAYLRSNIEEIDRLTRMVNDLILLSSLREKTSLALEEFDMSSLIQSVTERMMLLASSKHIRIRCDMDRPLPCIGDRMKLMQVLINILDNAIRNTDDGGRIDISAHCREDDRIRIILSDNGCGLSEEVLQNLFVRFYRSKTSEGLGLGLYLSRVIIRAHQGEITAYNNPGGGACFKMILPAHPESESPDRSSP